MDEKINKMIALVIVVMVWLGLSIMSPAQALVTMDVDKWNGPSGTFVCKDVKTCWLLYRAAEVRGDTYYCNSAVIKRDGTVVWYKNFYK